MIYEFSPALRPDARSLTFLGTPVSGMRSDGARGHRFDPDQVLGPAWSATLSLPNRTTPDGA
jgi:hypothetical protein